MPLQIFLSNQSLDTIFKKVRFFSWKGYFKDYYNIVTSKRIYFSNTQRSLVAYPKSILKKPFYSQCLSYIFFFYLHRKNHLLNLHIMCERYSSNCSSANWNFNRPVKHLIVALLVVSFSFGIKHSYSMISNSFQVKIINLSITLITI